ncbi:MAG TPA: hypothetical protein VM939_15540 [Gemmatimonadaceae bacterium]|nr:hypothetical protein [Gemmatimonadaceae bacterium]
MTLRRFVAFLLLSEAFAVTTFGLGWWSVPIVAAIWGAVDESPRRASFAAICAAVGWGTLLLLDAARGSIGEIASQLGGVMRVPVPALYLLTIAFPALLAWSAAALVPRIRRRRSAAVIAR